MPLGLATQGKWNGISMAPPSLHSYKHERPAYSTPHPVENTPANNECRMVELRGAKVASFLVGGDEFICLPQAFDLFLKHLVGGLHTVYTKLKRLSITPVVCNVEQVRILRGLGAIQPGVNRCKLITRKDFEILYQDCTQASRPGRPPKRYPMLPPTTDLMTRHSGMHSMNTAQGLLGAADFGAIHKRMRMDHDLETHLHQRQETRVSECSGEDNCSTGRDLSITKSNGIHPNPAEMYLQAHQALRRQYQQAAASGMHNGLDPRHAAAVTGINPALAPLMLMSHARILPGGISPTSMTMLNHINQFAQNFGNDKTASTAAAMAVHMATKDGAMQQQVAAAQTAYQCLQAAVAARSAAQVVEATACNQPTDEKPGSDYNSEEKNSELDQTNENSFESANVVTLDSPPEICNEAGALPFRNTCSTLEGDNNNIDARQSIHFNSPEAVEDLEDSTGVWRPHSNGTRFATEETKLPCAVEDGLVACGEENENNDGIVRVKNQEKQLPDGISISSMQTLLTNIQGLLKVAADNASLQEKHCSFEIADLKAKVMKERQIRGSVEKKYHESERIRGLVQKRLKEERKERKILEEQVLTIRRQLGLEIEFRSLSSPLETLEGGLEMANRDENLPVIQRCLSKISHSFAVSNSQKRSPRTSPVRYSFVSSPVPSKMSSAASPPASFDVMGSSAACDDKSNVDPAIIDPELTSHGGMRSGALSPCSDSDSAIDVPVAKQSGDVLLPEEGP